MHLPVLSTISPARAHTHPPTHTHTRARCRPRIAEIAEGYLESWAAAGGPVQGYKQLKQLTFDIIVQVCVCVCVCV